jgi:ABC-type multidrug transport system fused ATPase/permease subunit
VTVRQAIRASLELLSSRDRRLLALITLAQMSTSFLDLIGILLIGVVTSLSLSVMSAAPTPGIVQTILDSLGLNGVDPVSLALVLAVIAGVLLITKSALNMIITRRVLRFLANRQAMVSGRLAAALLSRPLLQVQQRSSQETVYALTSGVSYSTLSILGQGTIALSELALLTVLAIGLLAISPVVTIFTVVFFVAISFTLQRVLAVRAGRIGSRSSHIEVESISTVQEALRTYREAVVSQRRGLYVQRFQNLRWQGAVNTAELQFVGLIPKYVLEIALVVGAGVLAASQLLTNSLSAAVAIIAVFLAAGSRIVPSILRLQTAAIVIRSGAGAAAPTFELANELALVHLSEVAAESFGSIDPEDIRSGLERGHEEFDASLDITHVNLAYPGTFARVLVDVSLTLQAGCSLALVGPTGAGKSTLADVILGVLIPDDGDVRMGGLSPAEALAKWPGAVAYVPQDVAMANGSVRENVALGLPSAAIDDDWVWDALNRAHLGSFLRESREGLDTVVGEHGIKLSGGQRQRLGIARALYTRPKLLVLDEATSALDAETEQAISSTLQELEGTVTTVTIAHRLATIRHCDLIVYLENGAITAQGTFNEVRGLSPHFDGQAKLLGL